MLGLQINPLMQGSEISKKSTPAATDSPDLIQSAEALRAIEDEYQWRLMVNAMMSRYVNWQSAEFNGKIKMEDLPLDPTVKIYMEKGNLIQISLRVPLMGELGRIEATPDEIIVVNRYNRTYIRESMANVNEIYPGIISDLQGIFLGRVVIPESGELNEENIDKVTFYGSTSDKEWVVIPNIMPGDGSIEYGYVIQPNGRTSALYGSIPSRGDTLLVNYVYANNSMSMDINVNTGKNKFEGSLDFSSIVWGGERMQPANLNSGYRQVSIKDFIKNITKR